MARHWEFDSVADPVPGNSLEASVIKKTMLLGVLFVFILISGCEKSNSTAAPTKKVKAEDCVAPHNPYNDGGGHDAGFKWAEENGGNCDGNSESFNEGCTEFVRQLGAYNECIANSRK